MAVLHKTKIRNQMSAFGVYPHYRLVRGVRYVVIDRGDLGSLRASHRVKRKKQSVWTASSFERKTRLEPALRADNSRELYLHPQPLKGATWGRFVRAIVSDSAKRKKQSVWTASSFERKTRLELATPTLARLCSTN